MKRTMKVERKKKENVSQTAGNYDRFAPLIVLEDFPCGTAD